MFTERSIRKTNFCNVFLEKNSEHIIRKKSAGVIEISKGTKKFQLNWAVGNPKSSFIHGNHKVKLLFMKIH